MSEWVYFCEECGWLGPISEAEVVPYNGGEEEDVLCRTCKEGAYCIGDKWPPEPWSLEGRLLAERRARQEAEAQAAVMRSALGLTVEAYQGVGDFEGTGQNMAGIIGFIEDALSTDTGKQYLAIVEAARGLRDAHLQNEAHDKCSGINEHGEDCEECHRLFVQWRSACIGVVDAVGGVSR